MQARISALLGRLRDSDTSKAAGLAGAMIANNIIALVLSVVFARLLNNSYGSLAALISYLVILTVVGQAMQVATAREGVLGHLGTGEELLATLERWARALAAFTVVATIVSVLARQPIADAVGVPQDWAAAAGVPAGCVYLALCILRGALQGIGDYKVVGLSLIGEQSVRLIAGAILAVIGLGVAGAYLGSLVAYLVMSAYCAREIYRQVGGPGYARWRVSSASSGALGLGRHVWSAAVPITALAIIQLLQNVDLITAKHRFSDKVASSYAVAAVAAKVLIWVAMGAGFYLVPETSRLRSIEQDTRPVLLKSLAIVLVCAIPCMLIYAFAAHLLLATVFGKDKAIASSSLLPLGAAFTVLAATYLGVQYMLALKRVWFLPAIGLVAAIEPVLLLQASRNPASFATVVLFVRLAGATVVYIAALGRRPMLSQMAGAGSAGAGSAGAGSE